MMDIPKNVFCVSYFRSQLVPSRTYCFSSAFMFSGASGEEECRVGGRNLLNLKSKLPEIKKMWAAPYEEPWILNSPLGFRWTLRQSCQWVSDAKHMSLHQHTMGVARIFQSGGHTDLYRGYSSYCHLNIAGCLLTKRLTKGGSRAPQDPPWLRPCTLSLISTLLCN